MIHKKLAEIQKNLKAPKGQMNSFGGYKYRSCEDIVEAVKPLLGDFVLLLSDEIILIGERYYIKATAEITDGKESVTVNAYARETDTKKGMDASQITGSASSYARKYALNGLLGIDDTKDADTDAPDNKNKVESNAKTKTQNQAESEDIKKRKLILLEEMGDRLMEDADGDKEKAGNALKKATEFVGKDKKLVPGVKSVKEMLGWSFARVKIAHTKICTPQL